MTTQDVDLMVKAVSRCLFPANPEHAALAIMDCVKAEGQRILEKIEECEQVIRNNRDLALAAVSILKSCITHRGVTKEQAMAQVKEKITPHVYTFSEVVGKTQAAPDAPKPDIVTG